MQAVPMEPTLCMSYVLYSDEHVEPSFLWGRYFLSSTHFTDVESSLRGSVAYKETELEGNISKVVPKPTLLTPEPHCPPTTWQRRSPALLHHWKQKPRRSSPMTEAHSSPAGPLLSPCVSHTPSERWLQHSPTWGTSGPGSLAALPGKKEIEKCLERLGFPTTAGRRSHLQAPLGEAPCPPSPPSPALPTHQLTSLT